MEAVDSVIFMHLEVNYISRKGGRSFLAKR
jgi:hypothetical protein